jgi:hypothetical protein
MNKQRILDSYLEAALWVAEINKTIYDFDEETIIKAKADIDAFLIKATPFLTEEFLGEKELTEEQIGHDFWLTRSHAGAGFWDRGLGEVGQKLTEIAQEFGELNVFEETDGTLIVE